MVANIDIYRTAAIVVKEHGDNAATHATMRADKLLEAGDMKGRAVWLRVLEAVKKLSKTDPTNELL